MTKAQKRWTFLGLSATLGSVVGVGIVGYFAGADAAAAVVGGVMAVGGALLVVAGQFLIPIDKPDAGQTEGSSSPTAPGPQNPSDNTAVAKTGAKTSTVPTQAELKGERDYDVETWADSAERIAHFSRRRPIYATSSGGALMSLGGVVLLESYRSQSLLLNGGPQGGRYEHLSGVLILVVGGLVLIFSTIPYLSARAAFRSRKAATADALVDRAIRAVTTASGAEDMLPLPGLFELNRRQLDAYQQTTRRQQQLAFMLAQLASVVAFLVLIAGIVLAFAAHTKTEKFISGGLSGLGTMLSVFLARTFFASQKDANDQMNRYYLEPQRTGRLLAAERALGKIKNAKDAALLAEIVKALLAWEMPPNSLEAKATSTTPRPMRTTPKKTRPTGRLAIPMGGDKSAVTSKTPADRSGRLPGVAALVHSIRHWHGSGGREAQTLGG